MQGAGLAVLLASITLAAACSPSVRQGAADAGPVDCDGTVDCAGECNGDAVIDQCGQCGGQNRDKDCRGVCYGLTKINDCGFCTDDPELECTKPAKLAVAGNEQEDHFGESVSLSGDTAILGAAYDNEGGEKSGAAYIFVREDAPDESQDAPPPGSTDSSSDNIRDPERWLLQQKLKADDANADDNFGYAVAISGDYAVVGAYADDEHGQNKGSTYIFKRDQDRWSQQIEIVPPDKPRLFYFGASVAIDGDTAVISARLYGADSVSAPEDCFSGWAFAYLRVNDDWILQDELSSGDSRDCDRFGDRVAISGDTAVIGAPAHSVLPSLGGVQGSAYIFVRQQGLWTEHSRLVSDDKNVGVKFGSSVSISGETVMVGAHFEGETARYSGKAYIFVRDGDSWRRQAQLTANDPASGNAFGVSVGISGDLVVVGAPFGNPTEGSRSGAAYIFARQGGEWSEKAKLMDLNPPVYDWYGWNVAINDKTALIGGEPSGAAHLYTIPPSFL